MMETILRGFAEVRRLWEWGKLSKVDWDDLEWTLEQAGLEYASLLTHVRHVEQEAADAEEAISLFQSLRDRLQEAEDELHAERLRGREQVGQGAARESALFRQLAEMQAELDRAREEAELIVRSQRDDVPLFEEEGNDGDG